MKCIKRIRPVLIGVSVFLCSCLTGCSLSFCGTIGGGMLPKLSNCIDAIEAGVSRVHIIDGRIPHSILMEIFSDRGVGTAILGDTEEKFYHE